MQRQKFSLQFSLQGIGIVERFQVLRLLHKMNFPLFFPERALFPQSLSSPNWCNDNKEERSLTIDLRSVTTSVGADADVDSSEPLGSEEEEGLPDLKAESLGLSKVEGNTVDLDHSLALLAVGNGGGGFLFKI